MIQLSTKDGSRTKKNLKRSKMDSSVDVLKKIKAQYKKIEKQPIQVEIPMELYNEFNKALKEDGLKKVDVIRAYIETYLKDRKKL